MPLKEAEKSYQYSEIEDKVQNFWADNQIFSKVNKLRANGPQYSFLDGPPYCSGKIHLGTAWNKVLKILIYVISLWKDITLDDKQDGILMDFQ
jgi:isoleucyl-tRNA synthetase